MKSYAHCMEKLFEPALITPARWSALAQLLEQRMAGAGTFNIQHSTPNIEVGRARRAGAGNDSSRRRLQIEVPRVDMEDGDGPNCDDDSDIQRMGNAAIIPVHGTLVAHPEDLAMSECGCAMEDLSAMIDQAEGDSRIEHVIYDFRTPGGTVTALPETARKILTSRKHTVGFTGSECCSGGLWLAAQCQEFYGTQSSRIGSVGVFCMLLDMSAAMKKDGVKVNAIQAGKFKLMGAPWKAMTDEERGILQARVDKIYAQFKEAMESFRVVDDKNFGNGLVFDGEEAADMGFTTGVVESMDEVLEGLD